MKPILAIRPKPPVHLAGDNFFVRTVLSFEDNFSPFLIAEHVGPAHFPAAEKPRGLGEPCYRGCELVTIVLNGEFETGDPAGAQTQIASDDVQWITGGSGISHRLRQSRDFARRGGQLEFVQFWVNLPAEFKNTEPRCQTLRAETIPVIKLPDTAGTLRVIAGETEAVKGPAQTFTPVNVWDIRLRAGRRVELRLPADFTTALLVLRGRLGLNEAHMAGDYELALLSQDGNEIVVDALKDSRFLVLSGQPINEPIWQYDSFVMSSEPELRQAIQEFLSRQSLVTISATIKTPSPSAKEPPPIRRERLAYTLHEAADLLGVDYFSVYRLVQERKLRACRAMRRKILIPRIELLRLLKTD